MRERPCLLSTSDSCLHAPCIPTIQRRFWELTCSLGKKGFFAPPSPACIDGRNLAKRPSRERRGQSKVSIVKRKNAGFIPPPLFSQLYPFPFPRLGVPICTARGRRREGSGLELSRNSCQYLLPSSTTHRLPITHLTLKLQIGICLKRESFGECQPSPQQPFSQRFFWWMPLRKRRTLPSTLPTHPSPPRNRSLARMR